MTRALVCEPALVLADEPTGNLDPQLAVDILGLFEDVNETGSRSSPRTIARSAISVRTASSCWTTAARSTPQRALGRQPTPHLAPG
jgi:ABC-type arginine transport system ATPase subunit